PRADRQAAQTADAVLRRDAVGRDPVEAHVRRAPARVRRVGEDPEGAPALASAGSGTITTPPRSSMTIAASLVWLLYINWRLTLMTFFVLPIVAVVIRYFSRRLRRIARDVQTRTGAMTHVLEEMIGGHRIVRVFGGEAYERARAVKAAN